jgi:prolyl-tRNA synthetase
VAEQAYQALLAAGLDPLLDDRDERPGAKFASLDLVGLPWQLIVGPKGVAEGVVEIKRRATGERQTLPLEAALKVITG